MTGWARELRLGGRLALAGGRGSWSRTLMSAIGVGLGVALLLLAASVPHMMAARDDRGFARDDFQFSVKPPGRSARTLLISATDTSYRGTSIRGRLLEAEGPAAPVPPGLARLPGPGEMAVSPRLADLLRSPAGALLRPRLPYRIVATIAQAGLGGPAEYAYYAGTRRLVAGGSVRRIDHFGTTGARAGLDPVLALLVVIVLVVLLLPVAVFVAAAVRFGGEQRDRRLAALRLVGADGRMVRRIAAGEAAIGALAGLVAGAGLFVLGARLAPKVSIAGFSVFSGDLRPAPALVAVVVIAVPLVSVLVSVIALRDIAIDPLAVVRRAPVRPRRLWWRLLVPVLGGLLLVPLLGVNVAAGERFDAVQVATGVVLLLVGITALLPWIVERAVGRLGGGGVAWQLATRRLQHDRGASARVVSGIAVAVAGAITLQTLFAGVDRQYTRPTGADLRRAQAYADLQPVAGMPPARTVAARLRAIDGVRSLLVRTIYNGTAKRTGDTQLTVADCRTLRGLLRLSRCREGDAFAVRGDTAALRPGERAVLAGRTRWTAPKRIRPVAARTDPTGATVGGLLVTPSVLGTTHPAGQRVVADIALEAGAPDGLEHLRNAAARLDPLASVEQLSATSEDTQLTTIRRGLYVGAVAVLLMIGASMLVTALEQLHERRRLLAALVAFGTPRATIGRSILFQTAVPVTLGLVLAIATGVILGGVLLALVDAPLRLDLAAIGGMAAIGAAVVPLVTALSLPAVRRITRPEGLRAE